MPEVLVYSLRHPRHAACVSCDGTPIHAQARTILRMRFSIQLVRSIARLVLAALLLGQGVHFAQACLLNADRPAMAFTAGDQCKMHERQAPVSPNACLSQCLQGDQSSGAYQTDVPAAPNVVALVLPIEFVQQAVLRVFTSTQAIFDSSPPLAYKFCSLQL